MANNEESSAANDEDDEDDVVGLDAREREREEKQFGRRRYLKLLPLFGPQNFDGGGFQ